MTDGSNPKKVLKYQEGDISCDNEKVVSRRIFCIGAENAYYTGSTDAFGDFEDFQGGTSDATIQLCELIDAENWENGGYNKKECQRLLGPLDWMPKGVDGASSPTWSNGVAEDTASTGTQLDKYRVPDLNRGTLNPFKDCEDGNLLANEYALPYNCPFYLMWVSLEEVIASDATSCP